MNDKSRPELIIGIDGTNLRQGGGVTHLVELLRETTPNDNGISQVIVWSNTQTLSAIEDRPWLVKISPTALNRGLLQRILWQKFALTGAARSAACDLLFVPGGSYFGNFRPIVTMSQNMLPFEGKEVGRYGFSRKSLRLLTLRWSQSRTFRRANGVIFLSQYANDRVMAVTGPVAGRTCIIAHGLNSRFQMQPKAQRAIADYDNVNPFRFIYVSIIDQYKHQWHVVEAVAALRLAGLPVTLDLIGPSYAPALERLRVCLERWDPQRSWVNYCGAVPYEELHRRYARADLGIFASSCENQPIILLETMASGLPVACSNRGPMPEVLGEAGAYFDPEKPFEIVNVLRELVDSPQLRARMAQASYERSRRFTWQRCATETFAFLAQTAREHEASTCAAS